MTSPLVRLRARLGAAVLALIALFIPVARLAAQGVTTAAVSGRVLDDAGAPVPEASIAVTNGATGQRYATRAGSDGRYLFENLAVGGPYTFEARALGFEPVRIPDVYLRLGQRLDQDFRLKRAAVEVAGVTVEAEANPLINAARTGAQTFVSDTAIARLPSLSRNFTDFIQTVPQVVAASVPGATIGGQNNRFNNIQVDGGVNNDVFGLAASGTPGGQANAHPISIEAVKEYQVLIAPFDVRQGSFVGGLVNAVTKSGGNLFHGSVFGYMQNEGLVGKDTLDKKAADFHQNQYGLTLSGPIVRDRVHFFVSGDVQARAAPFVGQIIGSDPTGGQDSVGVGIRLATANRVRDIIRAQYGFDPGGPEAPTIGNPDRNIFAKVTAQLATNSDLELSWNYVKASSDVLIRNSTATGQRDGYELSNSGYVQANVTNTARAKWTAQLANRVSNELLLGYNRIRDHRELPNAASLIFVGGDRAGTNIAAGAERFSHANLLNQDIFEITDNLTFSRGPHVFTVGTHNEFFSFLNVFFPASLGIWSFTDTTALKSGTPNRYDRAVPGALRPDGPVADFPVKQFGVYVQDRWAATPQLLVTAGFRVDIPVLNAPAQNAALATALAVNTGDFPSGNALWSPRLGLSYDVTGDGSTRLRGGVGIFSGRPPYVWVSNAYANTGLEQATLTCTAAAGNVPAFTVDPSQQYTQCAGGGAPTPPRPSIVFFDSDFKYPQTAKAAVGLDRQLPWGLVGTLDFLYTKSLNQFYISDVNLQGIQGFAGGEGGRPLYGTTFAASVAPGFDTTLSRNALRRSASFLDVLRHRNESRDFSYSFTTQLQKRFGNGVEFDVGYTYAHTEDLFSLGSSIASSNYRFTILDGTVENRNLRTSVFDIPHKITASGTVAIPFDLRLSLIYIGQSGSPYSYVVSNDVNGDGFGGNDQVYVPRNQSDITLRNAADWTRLDNYINSEDCLKKYRGSLLPRNSCRNPWTNFLNVRLSKIVPTIRGQSFELTADVFNVLHLLNSDWGVIRQTSGFENANLLRQVGFDAVNNRGRYALALPIRNLVSQNATRWRMQIGLKYLF